jgi:hypothetical protein
MVDLDTNGEKAPDSVTQELALDEFTSILPYLQALVDSFPDALSHTELAGKVQVTPAAVSKAKEKLFRLCNKEIYGLYRKFKLSDDSRVGTGILLQFFLRSNIPVLRSKYARSVIAKSGIHETICKSWTDYDKFFSREDTSFVFGILLSNIITMKNLTWSFMNAKSEGEEQALFIEDLKRNFGALAENFHVGLKTKEDFFRLLTIRDKFYYLVIHSIEKGLENSQAMRLLKSKNEAKYKSYMEGYKYLLEFYLKRLFAEISKQIRERCPPQFRYMSEYDDVGHFYSPNNELTSVQK